MAACITFHVGLLARFLPEWLPSWRAQFIFFIGDTHFKNASDPVRLFAAREAGGSFMLCFSCADPLFKDEDQLQATGWRSARKMCAVGQEWVAKMGCLGKWTHGLKPAVPWWLGVAFGRPNPPFMCTRDKNNCWNGRLGQNPGRRRAVWKRADS